MNDILIGTHNSMSYLPIECKWYLYPIFWIGNKLFAQCQDKNIYQQIVSEGINVFDFRIHLSPNNQWCFSHGLVDYSYDYNLHRILDILSAHKSNKYYIRLLLEKYKTEEECDKFKSLCKTLENNYPGITFFGGNRKKDWKKLYQFKNKEFTDDNNNQWVSSMAEDARWYERVIPRLYAKRMNKINKAKTKSLTNLYDFI